MDMINYLELNYIASKKEQISHKLNQIYDWIHRNYLLVSRFSVVLIDGDFLDNFYVRDIFEVQREDEIYFSRMSRSSSLTHLALHDGICVINDITLTKHKSRLNKLVELGHRSSLTYTVYYDGKPLAFLFYNASETDFFYDNQVKIGLIYLSQVVGSVIVKEFERKHLLDVSLKVALNIGHERDPETKEHLIRMSKYSEVIARSMAEEHDLSNVFISKIKIFSQYHDIGKYKIPDTVLFNDKRFTDQERLIMNQHTIHGVKIISDIEQHFESYEVEDLDMLKNIILYHHERFDGLGHPSQLSGSSIPLEARIVTVADVFDALLSKRAYKKPWRLEVVIAYMKEYSSSLFDPDCVNALLSNLDEVLEINHRYVNECEAIKLED